MTVRIITDKDLWDRFVDASPYGLLFHKWNYLKIIEKHTGYTLIPYGIYTGNELICIFPVFVKKLTGMTFVFSPPPMTGTPYMGFVMSPLYDSVKQRRKESYLNNAIDEISAEIKKLSPDYTSILSVPGFSDIRPFKWNEYGVDIKYSYTIDLTKLLDTIWSGFDDNCKKSIRQSEGYNLVLQETGDAQKFFDLMEMRYKDQGLNYPIVSAQYLGDLINAFPDNLKMYFLYNNADIVGIELICKFKSRFILWMGESLINKEVPANYFLRWEFIKRAKEEGYRELEIEGANTKHLCANKSRFNPGLSRSFFIYKKGRLGSIAEWTYQNLVKKKITL